MMHSSPKPLAVALDMTKKLHHELAKHMTPEQRRDMARVERLITEAQERHKAELRQQSQAANSPASAPAKKKLFRWST